MNQTGKIVTGIVVLGVIALGAFGGSRMLAAEEPAAARTEEVQYQFEKGKGLLNVAVGDVFLGIGAITGRILPDGFSENGLTGSISFEMVNQKPGTVIQIDRVRLIERVAAGKGRAFEPYRVEEDEKVKSRVPRLKFLYSENYFPVIWVSGRANDYLYFVFPDLPADLKEADLVLTYNAKLPGKKHLAYFESRFPVTRKSYIRES